MANPTRAIPELSLDTQTLEKILAELLVGDVIDYSLLSASIGRDVQHDGRGPLCSARHRLLRDRAMVFEAVRSVGIKRLDDIGIVSTGVRAVRTIHNTARRGVQKLAAVQDFSALPNQDKVQHNLLVSQLGVLAHVTSSRVAKKLEETSKQSASPLPTALLLDALRRNL